MATFNSDTVENWISANIVAISDYPIEVVPLLKYRTFTGEILESSQVISKVRWCIDGINNCARSRYADFRMATDDAPYMVLLGNRFILSEEIFSFKDYALILAKLDETKGGSQLSKSSRSTKSPQAELYNRKEHQGE